MSKAKEFLTENSIEESVEKKLVGKKIKKVEKRKRDIVFLFEDDSAVALSVVGDRLMLQHKGL